jgi:hypothetical protein
MDFGIAVECDQRSASVSQIAARLSDAVQSVLLGRDYGPGLDHIFVGLLMLPTHWEGYERREFRFEKQCLVRSPFGTTETLCNVASVDATVDPQLVDGRLPQEQRQFIARAILSAVDEIGEHRESFPYVQFDNLRRDINGAMEARE